VVQLRSALEELGRVVRVPVPYPTWMRDEELREQLDGPHRERILAAAVSGQKALVVGAGWPRLVTDLAERGVFVSVIDPDEERLEILSRRIADARLLGLVTVYADDYKDRAFSASAFHMAVVWDTLNHYSESEPILKKLLRELKAGALLFLRAAVGGGHLHNLTPGLRKAVRSVLALLPSVSTEVAAQDSFLMPTEGAVDLTTLRSELSRLMVIQKETPHHRLAPDLADLSAHVVPALRPLVSVAQDLDRRLLASRPELARFVAFEAAKEKQLGRVFTVD